MNVTDTRGRTSQHGSDSGVIDNEGRFVPQAFENLFAKYDRKGDGTLTLGEIINLMHGQRVAVDPFGVRHEVASAQWLRS